MSIESDYKDLTKAIEDIKDVDYKTMNPDEIEDFLKKQI